MCHLNYTSQRLGPFNPSLPPLQPNNSKSLGRQSSNLGCPESWVSNPFSMFPSGLSSSRLLKSILGCTGTSKWTQSGRTHTWTSNDGIGTLVSESLLTGSKKRWTFAIIASSCFWIRTSDAHSFNQYHSAMHKLPRYNRLFALPKVPSGGSVMPNSFSKANVYAIQGPGVQTEESQSLNRRFMRQGKIFEVWDYDCAGSSSAIISGLGSLAFIWLDTSSMAAFSWAILSESSCNEVCLCCQTAVMCL